MKARTFISVEFPKEIIENIKTIQEQLKKQDLFIGKLTEPENIHLTLKFLGEIDKDKIEKVQERLKKIKLKKFNTSLGKLGVFSEKFIRIIWIKIKGQKIHDLQKDIDKALINLFPKEQRFMGHITIARVKKVKNKEKLLNFLNEIGTKDLKFDINSFYFKSSELTPSGPIYNVIEKYNSKK